MGFIDSHMHTIFLHYSALEELAKNDYEAVVTLAYLPVPFSSPESLKDHFNHLVYEKTRLRRVGITALVGIGLHPRCIPKRLEIEKFLGVIEEFITVADVIGEIGLHVMNDLEVNVLRSQLKIAREHDKPAIIHTPRGKNKIKAIKLTLKIIKDVGISPELIVIDHVSTNPEILNILSREKVYIGFTIQVGKASVDDVIYAIKTHPQFSERILLNSDAGNEPSDYLSVAKTFEKLCEVIGRNVAYHCAIYNARIFFRI